MTKKELVSLIMDADVTNNTEAQSNAIDTYVAGLKKPHLTSEQRDIIEVCLNQAITKAKLGASLYDPKTVEFAIKYFTDQIPKP